MNKKLKYIAFGAVLLVLAGATYLYKDIDLYKTAYYTYRLENKYEFTINSGELSIDLYMGGKPHDAIAALKDYEKLLFECLNYFRKNSAYIFELSSVTERSIKYDIGLNFAFLALKYQELGNIEKYDENIKNAINYMRDACVKCQTEEYIIKTVRFFMRQRKEKKLTSVSTTDAASPRR